MENVSFRLKISVVVIVVLAVLASGFGLYRHFKNPPISAIQKAACGRVAKHTATNKMYTESSVDEALCKGNGNSGMPQ